MAFACSFFDHSDCTNAQTTTKHKQTMTTLETATLASGCFWCTEAMFERIKGVKDVKSGYTGGNTKNPTYKEVCSGTTGHAEAIEIQFDPNIISYREILEIFFYTHDPTTLNRQGADVGTQYRSAIFYHSNTQLLIAGKLKAELTNSNAFGKPIVTQIVKADVFYNAEDYHQEYYENNKQQSYCRFVIYPKISKLEKTFKKYLKN
jgi:peptide-methionine (S)-S-oxide reductase